MVAVLVLAAATNPTLPPSISLHNAISMHRQSGPFQNFLTLMKVAVWRYYAPLYSGTCDQIYNNSLDYGLEEFF